VRRSIIETLEAAALIALIVALWGAIALEGTLRQKLPGILDSAARAAQHFDTASGAVAKAAVDQDAELEDENRRTKKLITHASDLLAHTDLSLNGPSGLLPTQGRQLSAIESSANKALADLDTAIQQAQPILANLNTAAQGASAAANDPNVAKSLHNLTTATQNANSALLSLDSIAASGNRDAAMLETRLRQALKPASLAKSILMHALGLAAPAAEVFSVTR